MGIANIINTSTSSGGGGGEIIRELVNSSDGQGLYFSNTGYIHLANNAAAEFGTSDFSIEFILNQTGEVGSSGGSIYQSATTVNNKFSIENHVASNVVKLIFFNAVGAGSQYDLSYNMAADYNEPTHYVVSCDRSGNAVLYRNGTEVASVSIAASASTNLGDGVTSTAMIGNSGSGYTFLGGLYRFRTFSKVLSHDEVNTCFQRADVQNALKTNLLTDHDLAFSNPTQSAMCQDRAGNSDGTMGGTIQQTQKIVQLNATAISVSQATARTPAVGTIVADKIGVGTGSPDANLSIVNTSGIVGMNLKSATNNVAYIDFGDSGTSNIGGINYNNSDDTLNLRAGSTNRLTISSAGLVTVGNQVKVTASSASAVAYSVGDAGTGLYNTGSNAIGLATNGVQRLNVNNAGLATFGAGAGVTINGVNDYGQLGTTSFFNLANDSTMTFEASSSIFAIYIGDGQGALFFNEYQSATVTKLAGSTVFAAGSASGDIRVYTAGNDATVTVWNKKSSGTAVLKIMVLGV